VVLLLTVPVVAVAGCTSTPAPSPTPATGGGRIAQGGTLTVGVWQAPTTLLDAGVVASLPFAAMMAAALEQGLPWYRATSDTATTTSEADYWSPDLATQVPTVANGGVQTSGCADPMAKMCVTWHLRQGVRWDDGSDLSAHDVCATFDLHWLAFGALRKPSPTPLASTAGWDQVIKCTELDRFTAVNDIKSQYGRSLALDSGGDGMRPAAHNDREP
jgi:ABC-type transport system substrate-binding protein